MRILPHQAGWQDAAAVTGSGTTDVKHPTNAEHKSENPEPPAIPAKNENQNSELHESSWWAARELGYRDFKWMKPLGTGQFGRVFKARERLSGERNTVAIKVVPKKLLGDNEADRQCEGMLHARVEHDNIIRLFGVFEDAEKQYLVLEYAPGGTLYDAQQSTKSKRLDERTTALYVRQLAGALLACHKHGVVHRDLKPENVVLDEDRNAKLCDFGWATEQHGDGRCGTLDYFSPQMVLDETYGKDADAWALGVLAFEMLTGNPPFERKSEVGDYEHLREMTMKRIVDIDYVWPEKIPLSRDVKHLVDGLLRLNPVDRFDMNDVLRHPWIVKHHKKAQQNE